MTFRQRRRRQQLTERSSIAAAGFHLLWSQVLKTSIAFVRGFVPANGSTLLADRSLWPGRPPPELSAAGRGILEPPCCLEEPDMREARFAVGDELEGLPPLELCEDSRVG